MRFTSLLAVLVTMLVPLAAQAKGPSFADLISELTLPSQIRPGENVSVAAKIDVAAFCARTSSFGGPSCVADWTPAASGELVLVPALVASETSPRLVEIRGLLGRGADGVYRGMMKTFPCQREGEYRVQAQEPAPAVATVQMVVASVAACTADQTAPRVTAVRLPERLKLPAAPPADNTGWTHGKLLVEVEDDASGALELGYQLTPADEPGTSYGGATIPCAACGGRWSCDADIPLCGSAALGDLAVRVAWVTDRAGRQQAWFPLDGAPFAVIHCGGESTPDPEMSCTAESDAGATTSSAPDAGVDAPAVVESTDDPPSPSLAKGSDCAVAGAGREPSGALLTLLVGIASALLVRSRSRRELATG